MSKLTNREYRNIAKRPSKRGFGLADRRSRPEETPVEEMLREAEEDLNELAEGEAEVDAPTVEFDENSTVDEPVTFGKTFEQPQALGSVDGARSVTETQPTVEADDRRPDPIFPSVEA